MATRPKLNPSEPLPAISDRKRLARADAYRLHQALSKMSGFVAEPRCVYALVLARKALQPLAEAIDAMVKVPEPVQQFEQQRLSLCREHANKDATGQPQISAEQHFIIDPQQRGSFEAKLHSLQQTFKIDIDTYQSSLKRINEFLAEPAEINALPTIQLSSLTGDLSVDQIEALFPILDDGTCSGS